MLNRIRRLPDMYCQDAVRQIAMPLLLFFSITELVAYAQLLLDISFDYPVAGFLGVLVPILYLMYKYQSAKSCLPYLVVLGTMLFLAGFFHDFSWDGQTYHMQCVRSIIAGWNPFWDAPVDGPHAIWLNSYPKGAEIFGAAIYALTLYLEAGKVYNIVLLVANLLMVYKVSASFQQRWVRWGLLLATAVNPVVTVQLFTYYVDGALFSAMLALALLMCLYIENQDTLPRYAWLILFFGISVFLFNLKFTAVAYGGLVWLFGLAIVYLYRRNRFKQLFVLSCGCVLISLVVAGANPYITNTERHGHPFWPVRGEQTVNIMASGSGEAFVEQNRFVKFSQSLFSQSSNANIQDLSELKYKIPGTIYWREMKAMLVTDTRFAGFGVWESLTVCLAVLCMAGIWRYRHRNNISGYWLLGIGILLSVFINPEAWWARYAPQFFVLPAFAVVVLLRAAPAQAYKWRKLAYLTLIVLVVNNSIVIGIQGIKMIYFQYKATREIQDMRQAPIIVYHDGEFDSLFATRVNAKNGIDVQVTTNLADLRDPKTVTGGPTKDRFLWSYK